jgi:hypothetical protein
LMEELAIECRVGHPVAIRKAESRRQKHDHHDAAVNKYGIFSKHRQFSLPIGVRWSHGSERRRPAASSSPRGIRTLMLAR